MAELPKTWSVPVVRADFTDDAAWDGIREKIAESTEEGFGADVDFVEDRALAGLDEAAIVSGYPRAYPHECRHPSCSWSTLSQGPRRTIRCLSSISTPGVDGRPFRALPRQVQSIQNNLSLANMDYVEFATSAGADGVFRGF
jgi:hypothetical protein